MVCLDYKTATYFTRFAAYLSILESVCNSTPCFYFVGVASFCDRPINLEPFFATLTLKASLLISGVLFSPLVIVLTNIVFRTFLALAKPSVTHC